MIDDLVQGRVTVAECRDRRFRPAPLRRHARPICWRWWSTITTWASPTSSAATTISTTPSASSAIIRAMGWPEPVYAHVPLIHGQDGAKLSKRHGALGVDAYRDELGILPEALFNYLLRLGWGHGDDEIISREQAVEWFDLDHVGKSPVALRPEEAREPQRPLHPRGRRRAAGRPGRAAARARATTDLDAADPGDAGAEAAGAGPQRAGRRRRLPVRAAPARPRRQGRGAARPARRAACSPRRTRRLSSACRLDARGDRSGGASRLPRSRGSSSASSRSRCARR